MVGRNADAIVGPLGHNAPDPIGAAWHAKVGADSICEFFMRTLEYGYLSLLAIATSSLTQRTSRE
jgi:hypothetical protein